MAGETNSHQVSLAAWDIPSTVVARQRFTIRAGAKSSTGRSLQGGRIEVCDAAGRAVVSGALGPAPWPQTSALYWTELSLPAPAQHGLASLKVKFEAAGLDPPHRGAAATFVVMVTPPPEHTLTVQVVEQGTAAAIGEAEIRLGAYRATTAECGRAELRLPKGQYDLRIWKVGYEASPRLVDIENDTLVEVAAAIVPEENADRAWRG